jgi:hypothetical protein
LFVAHFASDQFQWSLVDLVQSQTMAFEESRDAFEKMFFVYLDQEVVALAQPRTCAREHVLLCALDVDLDQRVLSIALKSVECL